MKEAQREYGLKPLADKPQTGVYDAIALAVAHRQFAKWGAERIRALGKLAHVICDVKSLLPGDLVDARL